MRVLAYKWHASTKCPTSVGNQNRRHCFHLTRKRGVNFGLRGGIWTDCLVLLENNDMGWCGQDVMVVLSYHCQGRIKCLKSVGNNGWPCFCLNAPFQAHKRGLSFGLTRNFSRLLCASQAYWHRLTWARRHGSAFVSLSYPYKVYNSCG